MDLSSGKKGVGKEYSGKIGIHPLVKVRSPGEEVHNRVRRAGNVLQGVVKVLQKLDPPGLAAHDLLRLAEILEVFMVGVDTNWVLGTEEKRATTLETKDNAKEFLVVGVIIGLRGKETSGVEGDGVEAIIVFLGNDDTQRVARSIRVKDELSIPIGRT
jgi:hypothetical protein